MDKPRYLTKSKFKEALDCPVKLYYTGKKQYANQQNNDDFLQSLAEGGFQVEELARLHYPNGKLIEDVKRGTDDYYNHCLSKTAEALKNDSVVIYEAAFVHDNLFIRADILVKEGNDVKLIEVKAKSFKSTSDNTLLNKSGKIDSSWRPYIYDLAFQKYVVEKAYPNWNVEARFMLADKSKVASIDGLNQLFRIQKDKDKRTGINVKVKSLDECGESVLGEINADDAIDLIYNGNDMHYFESMNFFQIIDEYKKHYVSDIKFKWPTGWHCKVCQYNKASDDKEELIDGRQECWGWNEEENSKSKIFDIWNFRGGKKLLEEGKLFFEDLVESDLGEKTLANQLSGDHRRWLQVKKTLELEQDGSSKAYLDVDNLNEEMDKWNFPLHFIDFETSAVALPFNKGRAPYEQVAFQYSHHMIDKDGTITHKSEWIDREKGNFPNFRFIRALKESLGNNSGTIFRFATHENTIVNAIYDQLEASSEDDKVELQQFIKSISHSKNDRVNAWDPGNRDMIDLCEVVKKYLYHPYMRGSNSIKSVLPAVIKLSKKIQEKYGKPIGDINLTSNNFGDDHIWITDPNVDPYKNLPEIDFSDLDTSMSEMNKIQNGGAALVAYAKLQYENMSDEEREKICSALLKYCELDTLAMVLIYEYFVELSN
jgi:hypothetical protein